MAKRAKRKVSISSHMRSINLSADTEITTSSSSKQRQITDMFKPSANINKRRGTKRKRKLDKNDKTQPIEPKKKRRKRSEVNKAALKVPLRKCYRFQGICLLCERSRTHLNNNILSAKGLESHLKKHSSSLRNKTHYKITGQLDENGRAVSIKANPFQKSQRQRQRSGGNGIIAAFGNADGTWNDDSDDSDNVITTPSPFKADSSSTWSPFDDHDIPAMHRNKNIYIDTNHISYSSNHAANESATTSSYSNPVTSAIQAAILIPDNRLIPFRRGIPNRGNYCYLGASLQHTTNKGQKVGFVNLGQTCFLSSCLVLCGADVHRSANQRCTHTHHPEHQCCVSDEINKLIKQQNTRATAVSPSELVNNFNALNIGIVKGEQFDAGECLQSMLQNIHAAHKSSQSEHKLPFLTTIESKYVCSRCGYNKPNEVTHTTLQVTTAHSIPHSLKGLDTVEELTDENQYECSKCKSKQDGKAVSHVTTTGPSLYITIGRSTQLSRENYEKDPKHVVFDHELPYKNRDYSLHGVVVHDGKTWKYGHYRAIAKSSDGLWYIYSDHYKPRPISARHVLKQQAMILLYCDETLTKTWNNTKPSPAIANNATSKRSGRRKKCRSKRSSSVHPSTPSNLPPSALGTANPSMAPNITTTTSGNGCPNTNKSHPTHPTPFTLAAKPSTITTPSKTTTNSPKSHPTPFTLAAKSSTITTPSKTTTNSPKSHPTPFTLAAKSSTITAPSQNNSI
eukprot:762969_1